MHKLSVKYSVRAHANGPTMNAVGIRNSPVLHLAIENSQRWKFS